MIAIVLCPGPSLATYDGVGADLVIAVNRAALAWPADVWACRDWTSESAAGRGGFVAWSTWVLGAPTLLTSAESLHAGARHGFYWRGLVALLDDLQCPVPNWNLFTATAAMVYASSQGMDRIEVYGADMVGAVDYDGKNAGERRDEARWAQERERFTAVTAWLASAGREVIRH